MLEPPDLDLTFGNESERGVALAEFLVACVALEEWRSLARSHQPVPQDQLARLRSAEPGESSEAKLRRWAALFDDELTAVFESRNRVAHGLRMSDGELRGAHWLASHLLQLVQPAAVA